MHVAPLLRGAGSAVNGRWWLIVALLLLAACQSNSEPPLAATLAAPQRATVTLGVSDDSAEFLRTLTLDPTIDTQWVANNDQALFDSLANGSLPAIIAHHFPPSVDNESAWFNPVALDGLVIIVHADNPLEGLTLSQLQALFTGQISNWAELGGAGERVQPVVREAGAGSRAIFNQRVMATQRVTINAVVQPTSGETMTFVASNREAIGYTMLSAVTATNDTVRILPIDGIRPTPDSLAAQHYPLMAPLYWVDSAEPTGRRRQLLAWLQGDEGQEMIGERVGKVR